MSNKYNFLFYNAFQNHWLIDGSRQPKENSIRITIITTRLIALFLVPAYSALLLKFILYPNIKLPFTNMQSFVQDGTYKLGFATSERWHQFFNVILKKK